jgi:hypothetical protein
MISLRFTVWLCFVGLLLCGIASAQQQPKPILGMEDYKSGEPGYRVGCTAAKAIGTQMCAQFDRQPPQGRAERPKT